MNDTWAQYGILGLVVIALASVIKILFKELKKKDEKVEEHQKAWREELEKITAKHERAVIISAEKQEKAIGILADKNERAFENITKRQEAVMEALAEKQEEALKDMTETFDTRQKETNQVIRETGGILTSLKTLLEQRWSNK